MWAPAEPCTLRRMKFTLRVLWGSVVVLVAVAAGVVSILGYLGISPNDARKTAQVFVTVANQIEVDASGAVTLAGFDLESLAAFAEVAEEIQAQGLLEKWSQVLDQELR